MNQNISESTQNIIELLEKNNVKLQRGLSEEELLQIESVYGIVFPKSLRELLSEALPVSDGFCNWRDFSEENVYGIKEMFIKPFEGVYRLAHEVYWNEAWGMEPDTPEKIAIEVKHRLKDAPRLIPLYRHRYMPAMALENPPVLSVHGVDVIIYGEDLEKALFRRFGGRNTDCIAMQSVAEIPFWSELL